MDFAGTFYQFGVVTDNLENCMDYYSNLGATGWKRLDTHYQARFRGWTGEVANQNAFAMWQGHCLEIVKPGIGYTNAREFLEKHGPGIFHLGFGVEDISLYISENVCFETLDQRTEKGLPSVIHIDTVDTLGYYVELAEAKVVDLVMGWIKESQ